MQRRLEIGPLKTFLFVALKVSDRTGEMQMNHFAVVLKIALRTRGNRLLIFHGPMTDCIQKP